MILTEHRERYSHFFFDEDGNVHGLYQVWYGNGVVHKQMQCDYGNLHGEYKIFNEDGSLYAHKWFEHDNQILDFLKGDKYPTATEELFIHKLTYQGEFIPHQTATKIGSSKMKLTEEKDETVHYFLDEDFKIHGLYQAWHEDRTLFGQVQYIHGDWHGEYKIFNADGSLDRHEWYEHNDLVLDFLKGDKYPTDEDERLIFKLTFQGEFLPK